MNISNEIDKAEASLDGLLREPAKRARQAGSGFADMAESLVGDADQAITRISKTVQEDGKSALTALRKTTREHPSLTVGIAAAAGIVLGLLMAARRS